MIIKVKVKPSSKYQSLEKISENVYIAHLKAPPEKGKANLELIKLLSKELSIQQNKIKIKNPTSRIKMVDVEQALSGIRGFH